jgi:hypothetical protein
MCFFHTTRKLSPCLLKSTLSKFNRVDIIKLFLLYPFWYYPLIYCCLYPWDVPRFYVYFLLYNMYRLIVWFCFPCKWLLYCLLGYLSCSNDPCDAYTWSDITGIGWRFRFRTGRTKTACVVNDTTHMVTDPPKKSCFDTPISVTLSDRLLEISLLFYRPICRK